MKAFPMKHNENGAIACTPEEADFVILNCPGPLPNRMIPVMLKGKRAGTGKWTWNGSTTHPTLKPSIRTRGGIVGVDVVCHSWVNDGKIQFLSDSTHELAGKTLDLNEVDESFWL